jgi:hypothetical protein
MIEKLAAISDRNRVLMDRVNAKLEETNTKLRRLSLPVSSSVQVSNGGRLEWRKHKGKWQLCLVTDCTDDEGPYEQVISVRETKAVDRVRLLSSVDDLYTELLKDTKAFMAQADEAIAKIEKELL